MIGEVQPHLADGGAPGRRRRCADCLVACKDCRCSLKNTKCFREGPLAHRVEQGTFNPKVPGSSPGRPTSSEHMYDARPLFDKLSPNTGPNNCWDR